MSSTIPIEEMRAEAAQVKARISVLTVRRVTLEVEISQAHDALEPITEELKELETRKAKLQDELEKQSNP